MAAEYYESFGVNSQKYTQQSAGTSAWIALGWVLCRAGQQAAALPWLYKAVAKAPDKSSVLNDYGWALTEL